MREPARRDFAALRSQSGQPAHRPYPLKAVPDAAVDLALGRLGEWITCHRAGLITGPAEHPPQLRLSNTSALSTRSITPLVTRLCRETVDRHDLTPDGQGIRENS